MELDGTVLQNGTVQYSVADEHSAPSTRHADADESRSTRKRRAILDAATTLFLRNGYRGTSMDEIAALAGVSKQTVYKHFADKERLFSEIVTAPSTRPATRSTTRRSSSQTAATSRPTSATSRGEQLALVMQPRLMQLRRLVIGEAGRFPELGRTFYERGPDARSRRWPPAFERLAARGRARAATTRSSPPPTSTGWSCRRR